MVYAVACQMITWAKGCGFESCLCTFCLDGPDFSSKSELMGFRADSVRTARTLHRLRTDSARTARTPHGLHMDWHGLALVHAESTRTLCSPCRVHKDLWGTVNYCVKLAASWNKCTLEDEGGDDQEDNRLKKGRSNWILEALKHDRGNEQKKYIF